MKRLKEKKLNKFLLGILILSIFSLTIGTHELSAGVCEKAFMKCLVDDVIASIATLIGGVPTGMPWLGLVVWTGFSQFCIDGFFWCLDYYEH